MRSSVTSGLPDRNRDCRQSLVAIINTGVNVARGCLFQTWLDVFQMAESLRLVPSGIFISFTFRATFNTYMHLRGATFHNKNRLET